MSLPALHSWQSRAGFYGEWLAPVIGSIAHVQRQQRNIV